MSYTAAPRLIAYAGQEGLPARRDLSPYSLFKMGFDTAQIATRLGISEHIALKRVTQARDRARKTRTEFERAR